VQNDQKEKEKKGIVDGGGEGKKDIARS